jgi:type I restriction enzyme, S subunit
LVSSSTRSGKIHIRTARRDLAAFAPATAQANINLAILSEVAVALPPIEEQYEIVRLTSSMLSLADNLLIRINTASKQVERSAQAVLAKAFRGELVTS